MRHARMRASAQGRWRIAAANAPRALLRWGSRWASLAMAGAALVVSPGFVAVVLLAAATVCAVAGVKMLAGSAWALIAASAIGFGLAGMLLRGLSRE